MTLAGVEGIKAKYGGIVPRPDHHAGNQEQKVLYSILVKQTYQAPPLIDLRSCYAAALSLLAGCCPILLCWSAGAAAR